MKIGKEAQRTVRTLLRASMPDGRVDLQIVRGIVGKLATSKPRGYLGVIDAFWRLVKIEIAKNEAIVESAAPLDEGMQRQVLADLRTKYGRPIEADFQVNPDLIGGMRIRVGSDVWDGSVKNRLERLESKFA